MTGGQINAAKSSRGFLAYIVLTSLLCGAMVMVIEVLGSRVIGPFYGVSLFVWTSLITVALVALALGYVSGGFLSDRRDDPAWLYGIILLAGLSVLAIPALKLPVLKACQPLGLRGGAFASSLLLFGPSLFLLGCVSPYIVKIAAREMKNIGRTVGMFSAVSTFGSFIGTVSTGFVLIAYFGVSRIFTVIGLLLISLSVIYFVLFRRRFIFLPLLLLPLLFGITPPATSKVMPDGTRITRVYEKESFYGSIKVIDYSDATDTTRTMLIDGLTQGRMDLNNKLPVSSYIYFMQLLPYALNPSGKSCLVVGLGAGLVPMWYEKQGIKTDVIEIDPYVLAAAQQYFGFRTSGEVFLDDARYHLNNSKKQYDYVVLDVFNGDTTPGHVLSLEALQVVQKRMSSKGVLAVNLIGSLKRETFMTVSIVETLKQVFSTVQIYPVFNPDGGDEWGNLAVIAFNGPAVPFSPAALSGFEVHPMASEKVWQNIGRTFSFPPKSDAIILTDNYNPVDFYDTWLKEELRRRILSNNDAEILG
jgi:spermidine synthase